MGSKGSQTTNTSQNQTYTPTGAGYLFNALNNTQALAGQGTPTIPTAPVAGLTGQQEQAFGLANNTGIQNPYLQQAANYFSPQGTSQFFNPMTSAVTSQLQNIFGQQQQQNNANLVQSAGGVGADRIAVGQGNLANQQTLAAGQTYANLYGQAAQQAQSAAYGTAGLGAQAQQANTTDIQNLLGAGGLQQQQAQAQLNAPYQQQLAQLALPYQLQQFYTGQVGALAPALGGTTWGQGTSTSSYNPSIFSQIAGAGLLGAGVLGKGSGGAIPYARGGKTNPYAFEGGGAAPIDISQGLFSGSKLFRLPDQAPQQAQAKVPQLNLTSQAPNMAQQGQQGLNQMASLGKSFGNSGFGDTMSDALQDMFDARGGRIYARGGAPNPYALLPRFDDGGGAGGDGGDGGDGSDGSAGGDPGAGGSVGGIGSDAGAVGEGGLGGLAGAPGIGSDAAAMAASMSAALGNQGNTGVSEGDATAQSPGALGSPNDAEAATAATMGNQEANLAALAGFPSAAPSAALGNFGTAMGTGVNDTDSVGAFGPGNLNAMTGIDAALAEGVAGFGPGSISGPAGIGTGYGTAAAGLGLGNMTSPGMAQDATSIADETSAPNQSIAQSPNETVAGAFSALGPTAPAAPAAAAASPGLPGALAGALAGLPGALSTGVGAVNNAAGQATAALGNLASNVNGAVGTGLTGAVNAIGEPTSAPEESAPAMSFANPSMAPTSSPSLAPALSAMSALGIDGSSYLNPTAGYGFQPHGYRNPFQGFASGGASFNERFSGAAPDHASWSDFRKSGNVEDRRGASPNYIPASAPAYRNDFASTPLSRQLGSDKLGYARGGAMNYDDGGDVPFELGDVSSVDQSPYQRLADLGVQRGQIDAAAQQAGPAVAAAEERKQAAAPFYNAVGQLESSGRGVNGPSGRFANGLYQQYPAFAKQYGVGESGIQNYARQVLKANPNATFGDFYGGYVTGTGNPATAKLQNLLTTTQPGARGAYANLMRNSPINASTPLAELIGGSAPGGDTKLGYAQDDKTPQAVLSRAANGQPPGGLPPAITQGAQPSPGGLPAAGAAPTAGLPGQVPDAGQNIPAPPMDIGPTASDKGSNGPLFGKNGFVSNLMNDPKRMALIMAGLGAWTPQGISGGFQQGAQFVQHQQSVDQQAKRLEQEANFHQQQIGETQRYHSFEMSKPVPYNAGYDQYGQPLHGVMVPERQPDGTFKWAPQTQEQPQQAQGQRAPDSSFQIPGQQGQGTTAASLDQKTGEGDIPYNARLVAGGPFDYIHAGPTVTKGDVLPEPQPVGDISPGALKRDAETYAITGKLPPTRGTRGKVASDANDYRHAVQNYGDALLSSRGISPEQSADLWRSAPGYLRWVTGPDGRSTVAIGNVMRHTQILKDIAKEWNAGNLTPSNALRARIATMFGSDAATNLEAAARIVAPETMKALGAVGAGGIGERGEVKEGFSPSASMKQILGATDVTERLLGEQLEGKEGQAALAGVDHDHFKRAVGEKPYEILEELKKNPIGAQQPAGGAQGTAPVAVPPAAKREVDKVYRTPKGSFRWKGNGWEAVP
jgi:hypothetical protein